MNVLYKFYCIVPYTYNSMYEALFLYYCYYIYMYVYFYIMNELNTNPLYIFFSFFQVCAVYRRHRISNNIDIDLIFFPGCTITTIQIIFDFTRIGTDFFIILFEGR